MVMSIPTPTTRLSPTQEAARAQASARTSMSVRTRSTPSILAGQSFKASLGPERRWGFLLARTTERTCARNLVPYHLARHTCAESTWAFRNLTVHMWSTQVRQIPWGSCSPEPRRNRVLETRCPYQLACHMRAKPNWAFQNPTLHM